MQRVQGQKTNQVQQIQEASQVSQASQVQKGQNLLHAASQGVQTNAQLGLSGQTNLGNVFEGQALFQAVAAQAEATKPTAQSQSPAPLF